MGSGGSFVAILLSVPLTVVALVGVVGVPKLQEMLSPASSHDDDEFDHEGFSSRSKRGASKSDRDNEQDADLWGDESKLDEELSDDFGGKPKSSKSRSSLTRNSKSKSAADSFGSDLEEESKDDFFSKPSRSRFGQTPREPEAIEMVATEPFKSRSPVTTADHVTPAAPARADGFAAAIERLRAMGVERFHLEPGLGAGQFLFVCQIEAAGESGTVHRFEAESVDPTLAVSDVMKQVATWHAESSVTKTAGAEFRR